MKLTYGYNINSDVIEWDMNLVLLNRLKGQITVGFSPASLILTTVIFPLFGRYVSGHLYKSSKK